MKRNERSFACVFCLLLCLPMLWLPLLLLRLCLCSEFLFFYDITIFETPHTDTSIYATEISMCLRRARLRCTTDGISFDSRPVSCRQDVTRCSLMISLFRRFATPLHRPRGGDFCVRVVNVLCASVSAVRAMPVQQSVSKHFRSNSIVRLCNETRKKRKS